MKSAECKKLNLLQFSLIPAAVVQSSTSLAPAKELALLGSLPNTSIRTTTDVAN
jgi:hypothetical protein